MPRTRVAKRFMGRRGLAYSLALSMLILAVGGVGFWAIEPTITSFPQGLWLAFTTAATVGYGDVVPRTELGQTFAVFVVLMGLGVLSLVTASVAALFVEAEERQIEVEMRRDMQRVHAQLAELRLELAAARAELAALHRDVAPQERRP